MQPNQRGEEELMISRVDHASSTVSDLDRSIAFYRDVLGMKVTRSSKEDGVVLKGPVADAVTGCPGTEQQIVFLEIGGTQIELVEYTPTGRPQVDNKPSDVGSGHICFAATDIQSLHRVLLANNARIHCAPQDVGPCWVIYFRDPDGNILEAVQPKGA
jgi:glyoxylase I family protein